LTDLGPWTLEQDGPLAVLTIDKPPLNLFDEPVFAGLIEAVDRVGASDARGLLLRAEGKVWTGGVDVHMFQGLTKETGGDVWRRGLDMIQAVEDLPFPVVFAAHGLCLTWGFELALACDLILAAEGAQFGLVEIVVGLTPSMGGPQRLAEKAGANRARELVFTGGLYDAATMQQWGVVNKVWPDDEFADRAPQAGHPRRQRPDGRARGDQAARQGPEGGRRPRRRRARARRRRRAVRDRGPQGRGRVVPLRRPRQGHLRGALSGAVRAQRRRPDPLAGEGGRRARPHDHGPRRELAGVAPRAPEVAESTARSSSTTAAPAARTPSRGC
jgi:enoyl-CoA hydratase/carnithine racemase